MVQDVNPRLYQDLNTLKSLGSALPNNPLLGVSRDFSKTKGTQTLATPAQDAGLAVIQDGAITTKSGVGNRFSYSLDDDTYFYASFPTVTGVRNTTTGWQEIGKILVPGDSLSLAPNAVASFSVTSGANLTSCQLAVLISPRNNSVRSQTKYYVVKDLGSGFASTTAQIKVLMNAIHPGMLQLGQVDAGTAPTSYPDSSYNKVFAANLLGGVSVRLFIKFSTSANDMGLTAASGSFLVKTPARNLIDQTTEYNRAPYGDTDVWKSILPSFYLAKPEVAAANPATTGDQSTGTLNASGTAGSDVLTVYSTTGVTVGMRPVIGLSTVTVPGVGPINPMRPHLPNAVDTLAAFGSDVTVTQIINSTQVRLSANLVGTVNLRGRIYYAGATDHVPCVAFYSASETACMRMGQGAATIGANPFTGITKTANGATAARSCFPIIQIKSTDAPKTWQFTQVNGYNPWLFDTSAANATIGFETYDNGTLTIKTPSISQSYLLNGSQNPDKNLVLITECGRYALEMIGADLSVSPATATRMVVTDLTAKSMVTPDVYDLGAISYGTRAYGGPLSGGVVRKYEMDQCYSTGNIAVDIYRAMNAIKHPIAILVATAQAKSNNYCPDPAVQGTKITYKAYRSVHSVHAPSIAAGGSGYVVGDALYVSGGTFTTAMSCVVTGVAGGAVTSVHVQRTGQYKTLPSDGTALATTTSGSGTGCVLNALSITSAPDQTTMAIAFPDIDSVVRVLQYPASTADTAYATNYAGTIPMGSLFSLPNGLDLAAEWTSRRTNAPTAKSSSYELLAVLAAIQKYGAYVTDVSGSFQQMVVVDSDFAYSANYSNLHGDTGGATYPNYVEIKRLLTYVENVSPANRGSSYANQWPVVPAI
jgi:hypothetical protein